MQCQERRQRRVVEHEAVGREVQHRRRPSLEQLAQRRLVSGRAIEAKRLSARSNSRDGRDLTPGAWQR
jgi:hypothetical protein